MTYAEQQRLRELEARRGLTTPAAPEAEIGAWDRLGRHLTNFVPDAIGRAVDTVTSIPSAIGRALTGREQVSDYEGTDLRPLNVPAPRQGDWGAQAQDVILGGVAPELPALLMGGAVLRGTAAGFNAGRIGTVLGDTALGAASGARYNNQEGATQAAEFGAFGAVDQLAERFVPGGRLLRPLLKAAGNVGIAAGGSVARGRDPLGTEGLIQAGVGAALPIASEVLRGRPLLRRSNPTSETGIPVSAQSEVVSSIELPDGRFRNLNRDGTSFDSDIRLAPEGSAPSVETAPRARFGEDALPIPADLQAPPRPILNRAAPSEGEALVLSYADNPEFQVGGQPNWPKIGDALNRVGSKTTLPEMQAMWADAQRVASDFVPLNRSVEAKPLLSREPVRMNPSPATEMVLPAPVVPPVSEAPMVRESNLPSTIERAGKLKPLGKRSQAGSVNPAVMQTIAGTGVGALVGGVSDQENPTAGAVKGALIGGGLALGGRGLARLGKVPRVEQFLRQNAKLGQDPKLGVILEQSRGKLDTLNGEVEKVLRAGRDEIRALPAAERNQLNNFLSSDRTPAAAAALLGTLPAKAKQAVLEVSRVKREMQSLLASGERDPEKLKLISDTLGTWQTQQYRAFLDPKWKADMGLLDRITDERIAGKTVTNAQRESIRADSQRWMRDVEEGTSGMNAGGENRIAQNLYTSRKQLTPAQRTFLGEFTDPLERELLSVSKLQKNAAAGKTLSDIMKLSDSQGQRFALSEAEWNAEFAAASPARQAELRKYIRADASKGLGGLGGGAGEKPWRIQPQVEDALKAQDLWDNGLMRVLSKVNAPIKAGFTLYNPGTWVRNYAQMGFQALTAGLSPIKLVANAKKLYGNATRLQWAKEDGILDAHAGAGEFQRGSRAVDELTGSDGPLKRLRRGVSRVHEKVKEGYGAPDRIVRAATYQKFLDEGLGKSLAIPEARRYAVEMTNRYTHNYSNVAPVVKVARNIPLVNPFITYTAEMGRIIKNLAQDVATNANGRRGPAALALTALLGMGYTIKQIAKQTLDEKTRKEFEEIETLLPEYMRSRTNVPIGADDKGRPLSFNATPWLPADDIAQFAKNILSGDVMATVASNPVAGVNRSPAINIVSEWISGEDTITKEQRTGTDRVLKPILRNALPPLTPGNYTYDKIKRGFTPNDEGSLGITDAQGRKETPGTAIAGLLGAGASSLDKGRILKSRVRDLERELDGPRRQFRAIMASNRTQTDKDAAALDYQRVRDRVEQEKKQLLKRR